jgi:pimeloyl-ACP methyl ester carboxylesterase
MVESVERTFGGTKLETEMPRLARAEDFAGFTSPVIVVAAEYDPLFPPRRVLPAARRLFPNLVSATVLTGSGHIPSPGAAARLSDRLNHFFAS